MASSIASCRIIASARRSHLRALPQEIVEVLGRRQASTSSPTPIRPLLRSTHQSSPTAKYNLRLASLAESTSGRPYLPRAAAEDNLTKAYKVCADMKASGVEPDQETYNALLKLCAAAERWEDAKGVWRDMELGKFGGSGEAWNHLIAAAAGARDRSRVVPALLAEARRSRLPPSAPAFASVVIGHARRGNLEGALRVLIEQDREGVQPTLEAIESAIIAASKAGEARIAVDLAKEWELNNPRRLPAEVWMEILRGCAEEQYLEGVEYAWRIAVLDSELLPDEGLCLSVLHVAGRHGKPDLGTSVVSVLGSMNVTYQEHHLAPLLQAFATSGDIKAAFSVLSTMRGAHIHPALETAYPIFTAIAGSVEEVDEAFYVLEQLKAEGAVIDVAAFNAVIQACAALEDLHRALHTYNEAAALGVVPNAETYNILLSACIDARNRDLGDSLLSEMKKQGIASDARTFERLIILCLTQDTYEDAFFFLEEMKSAGHIPPRTVYEALVRKCHASGDPRDRIALDEMRSVGYLVPESLAGLFQDVKIEERTKDIGTWNRAMHGWRDEKRRGWKGADGQRTGARGRFDEARA